MSDFQVNIRKSDIIKLMIMERGVFYRTISLAWELGYLIAAPLVILAFFGRFLDKKYDASPIFLLSGIFLAMLVSGLLVFRKTKKILEEAEKIN